MNESTARNLTRFKYAATLLGAMAVFALAPATAHALPVNNGAGDGGCHSTDKDGLRTSRSTTASLFWSTGRLSPAAAETITVSSTPKTSGVGAQQQLGGTLLSPVADPPKCPLVNRNVPVFTQQP